MALLVFGGWHGMLDDKLNDEDGRLAALRRYEILDTGDEEPFQRVVDLVQTILAVPIAAVTLIDADRQWLKAAHGTSATNFERDIVFCNETIKQREALAVPDAERDGRFAQNPM